MNKERKVTEENIVVVFDRDVKSSELNVLLKGFHGDVVINKSLEIDQDLQLECNLYVILSILAPAYNTKKIHIYGDLYCGDVGCYEIYVQGLFYSEGRIDSTRIVVGENLYCDAEIYTWGNDILVAGDLECTDIEAGEVHVCGQLKVENGISATKVCIGY